MGYVDLDYVGDIEKWQIYNQIYFLIWEQFDYMVFKVLINCCIIWYRS